MSALSAWQLLIITWLSFSHNSDLQNLDKEH